MILPIPVGLEGFRHQSSKRTKILYLTPVENHQHIQEIILSWLQVKEHLHIIPQKVVILTKAWDRFLTIQCLALKVKMRSLYL